MDECYEGLPCGDKPTTDETTDGGIGISKSSRMKQAYDDAVYLMNEAECELMIAEAYARLGNTERQRSIIIRVFLLVSAVGDLMAQHSLMVLTSSIRPICFIVSPCSIG